MKLPFASLILGFALLATSFAAPSPKDQAAFFAAMEKAISEMRPQTGKVLLRGDLATLNVPDGLQYLDRKDAQTILVNFWGNPPEMAAGVLGMLVQSPKAALSKNGWGMVITYKEDGHIDDAGAAKIDYADLLKKMQEGSKAANQERVKNGYGAVELVGWAEPPHYDPSTHKIYWAKDLAFDGEPVHTLNYCTRILGRRGVLEFNAVASLSQLPTIRDESKKVLAEVEFSSGNRYADYNQSTDKLATYGLAALVAGGIAGKMGFFKMLLVALVAAKKFVVVGVMALVGAVKRLFKKRQQQ